MSKYKSFCRQKILNSDYSLIIKDINYIINWFEYMFSGLPERPLVAIREINELVKAVIKKSSPKSAKLEYRKNEFGLTKFGFIEFSLAEELEFRYWRKERIRILSPKKILRYFLWLLILKKTKDQYLSRFTAWASIISFLQHYGDFFEFSDGAKMNEYETLIIDWKIYDN